MNGTLLFKKEQGGNREQHSRWKEQGEQGESVEMGMSLACTRRHMEEKVEADGVESGKLERTPMG